MELRFSKFLGADFSKYKSWYKDAELNMRLGPMDDDWLKNVMDEQNGYQYSVFLDKELVAVIGILFPDTKHPAYYITDFAIKPNLRNKGFGSKILKEVIRKHSLKLGQTWKTFVNIKNPKAKLFFERNGWISSKEPDKDDMYTLELKL